MSVSFSLLATTSEIPAIAITNKDELFILKPSKQIISLLKLLNEFLNSPFHLFDKKSARWLLIIVVGFFAVFFMNLYHPFNINRWYEKGKIPLILILSSFGIIGMIVLAISQLYIRDLFKITSLKMRGVILWFLMELSLLTLTMFFIYGNRDLKGVALIGEIMLTFKYTLLITVIPYTGVLLYLTAIQKNAKNTPGDRLVQILDENGLLHIAIDLDHILYLKSADNYVEVYFQKDSKIKKELVRTTMKKLEAELKDFPIRRCHRSFMVNIDKISLSEKSTQGLMLSLKGYPDDSIPVSKNFKPCFTQLLKEKNSPSSRSFIPNSTFLPQ